MPHVIETCYGSRLHCAWHNEDETDKDAYRICGECWHVYLTPTDLLKAWSEQWALSGEPWNITNADDVPACAYCAHDW